MTEPLLTVLMPVYNAERFLAEAIESILAQTFTAFELLVIDDGSTDHSVSLIKSFTDERIRLVENGRNLGISATLNKGISLSRSSLIARMDADDISHPQRLQEQYDFMQAYPEVALLGTWAREMNEEKTRYSERPFPLRAYYYNLHFTCWLYHPTVLFRKEAVLAAGGYSAPYAEDFDLWWKLIMNHRFAVLSQFLLDYRLSSQSLHQVTKKKEYEAAQHEQLKRNIAFHAPQVSLDDEEVECLQYHFAPLLQKANVAAIINLLGKMDIITEAIALTPNPNCIAPDVRLAGTAHKEAVLHYYLRKLPPLKGLQLALRTNSLKAYLRLLRSFVQQRLQAIL